MRSPGSPPRITQHGRTGSAHVLWPMSPHKNGLRIKPAVFGVDDGVSESAVVQGSIRSHHRPGAHHRDRHGVVSFPAHGGKEEEKLNAAQNPPAGWGPPTLRFRRRRVLSKMPERCSVRKGPQCRAKIGRALARCAPFRQKTSCDGRLRRDGLKRAFLRPTI